MERWKGKLKILGRQKVNSEVLESGIIRMWCDHTMNSLIDRIPVGD